MTASSASHAFPGPRPLKTTLLSAFAHAKYCTMDVAAVLHRYTVPQSRAGEWAAEAKRRRKDGTRFRAVIATPERRVPTASAVARPVNKAPARRAVITTPQSGGPFARAPPASNSESARGSKPQGRDPLGARFTRAGPACRTRLSTSFTFSEIEGDDAIRSARCAKQP